MSQTNENFAKARVKQNDEFYTRLEDIEAVVDRASPLLENKVILCNCEGETSNFIKYFHENFNRLQVKKVIVSCYVEESNGIYAIIESQDPIKWLPLKGHGDCFDAEGIEFLKQADIVITNPPFSLFRKFVNLIIKNKKDFLIIGHLSGTCYRNIITYYRDKKIYYYDSVRDFYTPDSEGTTGVQCIWYSTLQFPANRKELVLTKEYDPDLHPTYINFDGIHVDSVRNIPTDYHGKIGVPINFFEYQPSLDFEILGFCVEFTKKVKLYNPKNGTTKFCKDLLVYDSEGKYIKFYGEDSLFSNTKEEFYSDKRIKTCFKRVIIQRKGDIK